MIAKVQLATSREFCNLQAGTKVNSQLARLAKDEYPRRAGTLLELDTPSIVTG